MATKKGQLTQLQNDDTLDILHPETDADIVKVETGTGKYEGQATNAQAALEEVYGIATNTGSATIASESNNVVTIKAGVVKNADGSISNSSGSDITLGTAAKKGVATTISSSSTDNDLATAKAVNDAIDAMPEPMIFKGSLGTDGTITDLPAASSENEGYTYKVITDGTYQSLVCKVGDTVISTGSEWVLIPSGDEPSGTVTSVGVDTASGSHLSTSGSPVTSSGTITISVDSGYSIPSDTDQTAWSAKYDKPSGGIPKTDLDSGVQTSLGKADTALQENETITISGDASGSGKTAITLTLANSGVTAGNYSVVQVNTKGLVTAGGQLIEVGTSGQTTPSADLVVGGIFFKEI